jgi:aminoglycoside phosphotransferase (APT) family kinase protein
LIERTFDWLDANRPAEGEPVLNWGDARIGNMLYRDFRPVAVLDWEMATVGPREVDLAWMIFLHTFFADIADRLGLPGIPGFMDRAEMIAAYETQTGHTVRDLSVRTSTRGIAYGLQEAPADPDDLIFFRPLLDQLIS